MTCHGRPCRTVFGDLGQVQPGAAPGQQQPQPAGALPPWLQQQLALQQQHQQQLAATAAAAQALFPAQGPLLSELAGLMLGAQPGGDPTHAHAVGAGGSPPHQYDSQRQLQAAMAALGLAPSSAAGLVGGGDVGQQGHYGASPALTRSASAGADWGFQVGPCRRRSFS
jgi:hypothetical protein